MSQLPFTKVSLFGPAILAFGRMGVSDMEHRTRNQEMKYTMALGYAWGRKDGAPYDSASGRRAMVASSLDFAAWYAVTSKEDGTNLEQAWEEFTRRSPQTQRELGNSVKTLPYVGTPTPTPN